MKKWIFLILLLIFSLPESTKAASVRCTYKSNIDSCAIVGSCPSDTHQDPSKTCPIQCSTDFDIQCLNNGNTAPPPVKASDDCDKSGGICAPASQGCFLTNYAKKSEQCEGKLGSGAMCCIKTNNESQKCPGGYCNVVPGTPSKTGSENSALCPDGISVNTALGCLAAGNPAKMISQLLGWGAIVGAGIAFLMIVFAGIQIVLAGGDPKKVQAARELITSAITGLILIIFSVFLINLIGVDILGLSKLGFGS